MTKKILPIILLAVAFVTFFSCKKSSPSNADLTRQYFPIEKGKYVVYDVDSIYYVAADCTKREFKSQLKYAITDTFRDTSDRLSYLMDVFTRPNDGITWQPQRTYQVTPTTNSIRIFQDNNLYVKMMLPVTDGYSWAGNQYVQWHDSLYLYQKDWNYTYQNYHMAFNNGFVNFDNTVTVLEDDQSISDPNVDSLLPASRTYAKEVYAYNVGMIYKEWTHWTYQPDTAQCVNGYTVIMRATDHN